MLVSPGRPEGTPDAGKGGPEHARRPKRRGPRAWLAREVDSVARRILLLVSLLGTRSKAASRLARHLMDRRKNDKSYVVAVPVSKLYVGGFNGRDLASWIELSGDHARASLRLVDSPYVDFLARFRDVAQPDPAAFRQSSYFAMAKRCLEVSGSFFGARSEGEFVEQGAYFLALLRSMRTGGPPPRTAAGSPSARFHTPPSDMPRVFHLKGTDLFEIYDGHHRLAAQCALGTDVVRVKVIGTRRSYLETLIRRVRQTGGRRELYQPIDRPEFQRRWHVVRLCADRWELMRGLLASRGEIPGTMVDLACSYGWFVKAFKEAGWSALGIECDAVPIAIGRIAYGLASADLVQTDMETFLREAREPYDVVLCLSILHHYGLGLDHTPGSAGELLRALDRVTRRVLFLDTGQGHEAWYRERLGHWNDQHVQALVREHTTFTDVIPLGRDRDSRDVYRHNYGRMLFACVRRT